MSDLETGSVEANGLRFAYLARGAGPLALCLHGFPDHPLSFAGQLEAFAAAGYRAVAPFMRGYGATAVPAPQHFQGAALARDAVALIDALGGGRAVLLGHDWGAFAAYGAAVLAPDKVAKLITLAVPYGPGLRQALLADPVQQRRSWYMFFFLSPFAEAAVAREDFAFLDRLVADWSPGWTPPAPYREAVKVLFRAPGTLPAALGYYRHAFRPELQSPALRADQERLGAEPVRVPTLYLHGARDGCIGAELVQGMEALFPRGLTTRVVPGAGHFLHLENPREVNDAILRFLAASGSETTERR